MMFFPPRRYMAPELMEGRERTNDDDEKTGICLSADIFSFAITLWEIVSLEKSHKHISDVDSLIQLVAHGEGRPSLEMIHNSSLRELLKNCWNSEPSQRLDSKNLLSNMENVLAKVKYEEEANASAIADFTNSAPPAVEDKVNTSVVDLLALDGLSSRKGEVTERPSLQKSSSLGDQGLESKENTKMKETTARKQFKTEKTASTVSVETLFDEFGPEDTSFYLERTD